MNFIPLICLIVFVWCIFVIGYVIGKKVRGAQKDESSTPIAKTYLCVKENNQVHDPRYQVFVAWDQENLIVFFSDGSLTMEQFTVSARRLAMKDKVLVGVVVDIREGGVWIQFSEEDCTFTLTLIEGGNLDSFMVSA